MTRMNVGKLLRILITASAMLLLGALLLVTFFMVNPIGWDGLGRLGALALMFPTQLLLVPAASIFLTLLCYVFNARTGALLFATATTLSFLMATIPMYATLDGTRQRSLPVSLPKSAKLDTNDRQGQQERTETYLTLADGTDLKLDIWAPPVESTPRPAIIKVHGGAWTHGARHEMTAWDHWLRDQGYTVFDISYRLSPPARWQEAVGDVKAAFGWVISQADRFNIDPNRLCLMGYSAGGHLSMLAAYTPEHPMLPATAHATSVRPACVINLYGISDLSLLYENSGSLSYIRSAMRDYVGGTPAEYQERYHLVSPIHHVERNSPPTLTLLGRQDRIVPEEQAVFLDKAFRQAGAYHELWLIPAADHGFDFNWNGLATQAARQRVHQFLEVWVH